MKIMFSAGEASGDLHGAIGTSFETTGAGHRTARYGRRKG